MMPSLVADDDNPHFPPKTERFLLVGGPKHGEHVDIIDSDRIYRTFAMPKGAVGYEATTYIRRDVGFQDPATGDQYVRSVFIHESIPNEEIAQRFLMDALLTDFIKGFGRKVGNANDGRSDQRRG